MRNLIFCRTHDEVNMDLARSWCDEHGLVFQHADQRDELFLAEADAIVFDLNHLGLTSDEREQLVTRICNALLPYPAAVACYDFEPQEVAALAERGLLVFRSLGDPLFRELARAIGRDSGDVAA